MAARDTKERRLTIGAVRERLADEFPDISISKIRYLEGQGLLAPRRTRSGYRLYSEDDVERLRTILRLQRDEFLPLRVIREELASPSGRRRTRRRSSADALLAAQVPSIDLRELCDRSGAEPSFVRELEEYGLLEPVVEGGERRYPERDADVVAACARLSRYGIAPRNLRSIRNGASSAASLLEQIVAPALRSRNPERRLAGVEDLEALATASQELSQLLFWRALRSLV
ncbi:MAG: MerR family transcriptional regulator [Thermoleophilia bacterium]|nr:MerR family transcriptional regulator [Thermoleophilia bacterium]